MASSDTYGDIIISSALLIASTLYQQITRKQKSTIDVQIKKYGLESVNVFV